MKPSHNIMLRPLNEGSILALVSSLCFVAAILDVTMVIDQAMVGFNKDAYLKCVGNEMDFPNDESIFAVAVDTGSGRNLTEERVIGKIEPEMWPGRQLQLLATARQKKYGFISCTARDHRTREETKVIGIVLSSNAMFIPLKYNFRASLNESVKLSVIQPRRRPISNVFWLRVTESNQPETVARAKLSLNFGSSTEKEDGFYLIFHQVRDSTVRIFQQGLTRLIVRDCIAGKYGEDCSLDCLKCENGGICDDKNGTCICPPGFMGGLCEIGCGSNKFGAYCQHNCTDEASQGCKDKVFCLPDPFGCSCATGYAGMFCEYDCLKGMYGSGCDLTCHCIDDECDAFTGNCTIGCASGWMGINCRTPCINGTYGQNCNETCGFCSGGSDLCNRFSGFCPKSSLSDTSLANMGFEANDSFCLFGFDPPLCKEGCLNGTWGLDCNKYCHCLNNTKCNVEDGFCLLTSDISDSLCEPGWKGRSCNETCDEGWYGESCQTECGHCKGGESCHPISGACITTRGLCDPGYEGWKCDEKCGIGYFGERCNYVCNCANGTWCDHVTGGCDGYCQAGFTGSNCHDPCPSGTYGLNCSNECGNCKPIPKYRRVPLCQLQNGKCSAGCTKAWSGDKCLDGILCDQNPCFNEGTCVQTGDFYSCKCTKAYSGSHCEIRNPPCASSPCLNNGTCIELSGSEFSCNCTEDYEGDTCEIDTSNDGENPPTKDDLDDGDDDEADGGSNYDVDNEENEEDVPDHSDKGVGKDIGGAQDHSMLILVAMCLGALLLLALIAFAYNVCFKKPSSSKIDPAPLIVNPPDAITEIHSSPRGRLQTSPAEISINRSPSIQEENIENDHKRKKKPKITEEKIEQEFSSPACSTTSTDASPVTTSDASQEESIEVTETTSSGGKLTDSIEVEAPSFDPFTKPEEAALSQVTTPPSGPISSFTGHPITLNRDSGRRRVSRRKVKVRFSRSSLDRLDEITKHNFRETPEKKFVNNEITIPKTPIKNNGGIPQARIDPWDSRSSGKKLYGPSVYGITNRDVSMLITTPRSADEEFEMEARKGPVRGREKPMRSLILNSKQD